MYILSHKGKLSYYPWITYDPENQNEIEPFQEFVFPNRGQFPIQLETKVVNLLDGETMIYPGRYHDRYFRKGFLYLTTIIVKAEKDQQDIIRTFRLQPKAKAMYLDNNQHFTPFYLGKGELLIAPEIIRKNDKIYHCPNNVVGKSSDLICHVEELGLGDNIVSAINSSNIFFISRCNGRNILSCLEKRAEFWLPRRAVIDDRFHFAYYSRNCSIRSRNNPYQVYPIKFNKHLREDRLVAFIIQRLLDHFPNTDCLVYCVLAGIILPQAKNLQRGR